MVSGEHIHGSRQWNHSIHSHLYADGASPQRTQMSLKSAQPSCGQVREDEYLERKPVLVGVLLGAQYKLYKQLTVVQVGWLFVLYFLMNRLIRMTGEG